MIQVVKNPIREGWKGIVKRPVKPRSQLDDIVKTILDDVQRLGDQALMDYTQKLDGAELKDLRVSQQELMEAEVDSELQTALEQAIRNIEKFHKSQRCEEPVVETMPGVKCWRKSLPIYAVGLYIPGGSAPLFSTVLMLGVPAILAGCREVVLCTPPDRQGKINPAILVAARLVGIEKVFKVGGAQAIAAMAYGTESIPQVDKIFGPGNQFVTRAKEMIQQQGVAIDMPAGPSEVLIIADESCDPAFVAADLLSQAEHGTDSQVMLLSTSEQVVFEVQKELEAQLNELPRKETACKSLENSQAVILESLNDCVELSNLYAPEHLIIATGKNEEVVSKITNAGSVFIGNYSCESAGDYASGTNHTLPTNGFARNYSGVSLDSFVKKVTFQEISAEGIRNIGPTIEIMAEAEQLQAHKNAVSIRLKSLNNV